MTEAAGQAARLFVAVARRQPMREVESVLALQGRGFEGCMHGRPGGSRQVLLVEEETLDEFALEPGIIRENITTRGLRLGELAAGQRLQVGEATLEVTEECEPCDRMDEIRMGLQEELRLRRGMLSRVVRGGLIRRGDSIRVDERVETKRESGGQS